jgi:dTDP-4-dehydrorhamnose 3,5-epimerase
VRWDDPALAIRWPLDGIEPQLSGRDRQWPVLGAIPAESLFP